MGAGKMSVRERDVVTVSVECHMPRGKKSADPGRIKTVRVGSGILVGH